MIGLRSDGPHRPVLGRAGRACRRSRRVGVEAGGEQPLRSPVGEVQAPEPLHAVRAVVAGHHEPHRVPVLRRQRRAVEFVGEEHVAGREALQRQVLGKDLAGVPAESPSRRDDARVEEPGEGLRPGRCDDCLNSPLLHVQKRSRRPATRPGRLCAGTRTATSGGAAGPTLYGPLDADTSTSGRRSRPRARRGEEVLDSALDGPAPSDRSRAWNPDG